MVEIDRLSSQEWATLSENAHLTVFEGKRPAHLDRIDYALLAKNKSDLFGYVTVKELDAESVYWQYGGAFPGTKNSVKVLPAYVGFINWTKKKYKRISTLVENTNIAYLKLAMSCGFRIVGVEMFNGVVLVKLINEFNKKEEN